MSDGPNWEAQRDMDRDVRENHKLYAALAGACSCDECKGESWYTGEDFDDA